MSLLQKASIITTPTAYAEDYLYSIKPAYALGSELVTNGNFSDGTNNWIIDDASNGSISVVDNKLQITSNGGTGYPKAEQAIATEIGITYQISLEMTSNNTGFWLRVGQSLGLGGFVTYYSNNKTSSINVLEEFTAISTTTYIKIFAEQNDAGSFFIDNVSVKEVTDADFDFDRNSTGTRLNEDYLIEDVPYNLLTYSEEITSGNGWIIQSGVTVTNNDVLAPNGTLTADKLVGNGTVGVYKQVAVTGVVTRSVYLKSVTGNVNVVIKDPMLTVTTKTLSVTQEWQRFELSESNGHASFSGIWIDDIPASGIYMWGAQLVKGDQPKDYLKTTDRLDIPRIDYTNGEPSILLEPQSTNLVTYSNDYTQSSWVKQNFTANSETTTAPDGLQISGYDFGDGYLYMDLPAMVNGASYTNSIYIKANKNATIGLRNGGAGDGTDDTSINLTTSWQRFTATSNATNTNAGRFLIDNRAIKGFGVSDLKVFVYGAQNEKHSYATSLIHTSGSAVTRSADAANNAGNSDLINSTEGVLYGEIKALANDGTSRHFSINDGTAANKVEIYYDSTTNEINGHINVSGASSALFSQTFATVLEYHKVAVKYKANDFSMFVDGTQIATDTSGVVFPANTLNNLAFDKGNATLDFYADVKSVMVFKEALTDLELEKLTGYNNHELYMNYYNRLSYLGLAEEYNVESDINNYIL